MAKNATRKPDWTPDFAEEEYRGGQAYDFICWHMEGHYGEFIPTSEVEKMESSDTPVICPECGSEYKITSETYMVTRYLLTDANPPTPEEKTQDG